MNQKKIDYRNVYDQVWRQALRKNIDTFGDIDLAIQFLNKTSLLKKQSSILEIGCATGKLCKQLYDMGYHNLTGIDISSVAIAYGKRRFPDLNLYYLDANLLKTITEHYDLCLSFDLVEHLANIDAHFCDVWNILKPGGKYLFSTPNILSNSLYETIKTKGLGWKKYHPSLQFSWTLKKMLLKAKFKRIYFIKIPPLSKYKIQIVPTYVRWVYQRIPWKFLPLSLQLDFYVIADKEEN